MQLGQLAGRLPVHVRNIKVVLAAPARAIGEKRNLIRIGRPSDRTLVTGLPRLWRGHRLRLCQVVDWRQENLLAVSSIYRPGHAPAVGRNSNLVDIASA